jgi:hypothetical protein
MRSPKRVAALVALFVFAFPAQAFAVNGSAIIPEWLDIAAAGVGLLTALVLLIDAIQLRRVAKGSVVAENIQYMILAVVCFAGSMLLRWLVAFSTDVDLAAQLDFTADLLIIAGMALLAVYFYRVRAALQRYLDILQGGADAPAEASAPAETPAADDSPAEGDDG